MKKQNIKLNEEQLKKIVAESVKRILKENEETFIGDELQTIKDAVDSIKQKINDGNLAGSGYDPTSDSFLRSKVDELDEIINELLSDSWY